MKVFIVLFGVAISGLLTGAPLLADAEDILKQREAVLSKIVAELENRRAVGTADDESVHAAQLALASFRRDVAESRSERVRHQERIVALQEKRLERLRARAQTGTTDPIDLLRATDDWLEARQVLDELSSDERDGGTGR